MFRQAEADFGWSGGAAALRPPVAFGRAAVAPRPAVVSAPAGTASRSSRFACYPDLGAGVGSARWWRQFAAFVAMCCVTIALAPTTGRLPASTEPTLASVTKERIAQGFAPLGRGATTGRRMTATDAVRPLLDTPERARIALSATLAAGDTLTATLVRLGVDPAQSAQASALIGSVADVATIAPGTVLNVTLGARTSQGNARPLDRLDLRARFDLRVAVDGNGGTLRLDTTPIAVERGPMRITGRVGEGLYLAARAAGAPPQVVEAYIRTLAPKVSMGSLAPDDRFDFVVDRARAVTGEVRYGRLLYVGLDQAAGRTRMIEWSVDGRTDWYDEAGVSERRGGFVQPVAGAHQTSGFGLRWHPILGYSRMHQGIDFGVAYGTPIRAVSEGVVAFAGWHGGHGNMVKLAHAGGLGSGYAHMSQIAVALGTRVAQGQVIGFVGSTGLSTGPHLHFEIYRNGVPVDPHGVDFASSALLAGDALAAFKARIAWFEGAR